jgi:hypothetical protein
VQILGRQASVAQDRSQRSLWHVLPGMDRHGRGPPVRVFEPVMAAAHSRLSESGSLQRLN